jgi:riboflavin-specific deaminase-like protein
MSEIEPVWQAVLELSRYRRKGGGTDPSEIAAGAVRLRVAGGSWTAQPLPAPALGDFLDLYMPYALAPAEHGFAVAHLGQSLDGRIATASGSSRWVTGEEDLRHNHRMRALADAVLVGAATIRCDDPQLTVRDCTGHCPVRVVLDPERRLEDRFRVFRDGAAPTLLIVAADRGRSGDRFGEAEILALPREHDGIAPSTIRRALAARGLRRLFVEGGGITVSRFVAARALDRLQIAVSPLIIGSGRPGISLPEIADLRRALRPQVRRFQLGADALFECIFDG